MKIIRTTDYYIDTNELKGIIQQWFKDTYGKDVPLNDILINVRHTPYCDPEFDNINIIIEEEVTCNG